MSVRGIASDQHGGPSIGAARVARTWHFGTAMLDERKLELTVGGEVEELDRKAVEVLRHFLRHAGEVVTKDELLAAVWPGRILSDSALTSCVARLREALKDEAQDIIKTVHGYGYRLVAQVRITNHHTAPAAHFDFRPGDHPPGRPLWSLIRRLGAGGHGEAWLGAHDKTREQRVFKFAKDEASLGALKREITLFRLLHDSLGERARVVELLDWNLELQPYFIESRYIVGGSLVDWAERHGKLGAIPLATRLDVAAQIADALAAVHGVGVLHKDVKPSNILVEEIAGGAPKVRLADFGSGGLLDAERLEAMGITRAGFTQTLKLGEAEGTLLYLAPEVVAGQIPTVKADIYALGVMLYQLVLGDFRAAMSPGWERSIEDELLRECIADAAVGEPELRLADAAALAQRLRTLEQTREQRRREREAKAKAEAATRALERLRARRVGLIAAGVAMVAGTVTSTALYLDARKSRDEATAAAASSQAVADFLSKDLFAVVGEKPLRDMTVVQLLTSASENLAKRDQDLPAVAAQLHAALGQAFFAVEDYDTAEKHLDQALHGLQESGNEGSEEAVAAAAKLVGIVQSRPQKLGLEMQRYERTLAQARLELGHLQPQVANLRIQIGGARFATGEWRRGADELEKLINDLKGRPDSAVALGMAQDQLCSSLLYLGDFSGAKKSALGAISSLSQVPGLPSLAMAAPRIQLARALIALEAFADAEQQLAEAEWAIGRWTASETNMHLASIDLIRGLLALRRGESRNAITTLESTLATLAGPSWSSRRDTLAEFRVWLAESYFAVGRHTEAIELMQEALKSSEAEWGSRFPLSQKIRIDLAHIQLAAGDRRAARLTANAVDRKVLAALGTDHPYWAGLHHVEGLLDLADNERESARVNLGKAVGVFESRYGPQHSFSRRARSDLRRASLQ